MVAFMPQTDTLLTELIKRADQLLEVLGKQQQGYGHRAPRMGCQCRLSLPSISKRPRCFGACLPCRNDAVRRPERD